MFITVIIDKDTRRRAFIAPDAIMFIQEGIEGGSIIALRSGTELQASESFDDIKAMLEGLLEDEGE